MLCFIACVAMAMVLLLKWHDRLRVSRSLGEVGHWIDVLGNAPPGNYEKEFHFPEPIDAVVLVYPYAARADLDAADPRLPNATVDEIVGYAASIRSARLIAIRDGRIVGEAKLAPSGTIPDMHVWWVESGSISVSVRSDRDRKGMTILNIKSH